MSIAGKAPVEDRTANKTGLWSIRSFLIESFRQYVEEASDDLVDWLKQGRIQSKEVLKEVLESIRQARVKLDELPESGAERWTATLRSVSGDWWRLRIAMRNARVESARQANEELEARVRQETQNRPMFLR